MARSASSDFLHAFRFAAKLKDIGGVVAGFQAITMPEYTLESVEYKEGHQYFTRKYPGGISVSDITFSKGVVLGDTDFYKWVLNAYLGNDKYRTDVEIYHLHRMGMGGDKWAEQMGDMRDLSKGIDLSTCRVITLKEAFPIHVKLGSDFDATSNDISVAEMDLAFEYFTVSDPSSVLVDANKTVF